MDPRERQLEELAGITADELEARGRKLVALARELREEAGGPGRELIRDIAVVMAPEPEQRPQTVEVVQGRFGPVTATIALARARELGTFSQTEFAEKLGLRPPAHQRWISGLIADELVTYSGGEYTCLTPSPLRDWVVRQEDAFSPDDAARACQMTPARALEGLNDLAVRKIVRQVDTSGLFRYDPPHPSLGPTKRPRATPPEEEVKVPVERPQEVRRSAKVRTNARQRSTSGQAHKAKQRDLRYNRQEAAKEARRNGR